jgi:hypothetical protein
MLTTSRPLIPAVTPTYKAKSSLPAFSPKQSPLSVKSVKGQILRLVNSIARRKEEHRQMINAIESRRHKNLRVRACVEKELQLKEGQVKRLQTHLSKIVRLDELIGSITSKILKDDQFYRELLRRKSEIERQNFTAARDAHSNSEAMRRLRKLKQDYERRLEVSNRRADMLGVRRIAAEKTNLELTTRAGVVKRFENTVESLEREIAEKGIEFSGTLNESQKELRNLDQLASHRKVSKRGRSFAQQLSLVLREGQSLSDELIIAELQA